MSDQIDFDPFGSSENPIEEKPKRPMVSPTVAAMNYLARRDHSEKELRTKLSAKYNNDEIDEAIEYVLTKGWLLPPEELALKTAKRLHEKGKGYLYIVKYLKDKGLPSVEKDEGLEIQKALDIIASKFDTEASLSWEQKQKIGGWLNRRGFDYSTVRACLDELTSK